MSFFRDVIRKQRVRRHVARHGYNFDFHGVPVVLPRMESPGCANALIKGKYEAEEAELIIGHLPVDQPVIELGGSLGIVSALIGSRLVSGVSHVIVEANPDLIATCALNAGVQRRTATEIRQAAVFYDGPVAQFAAGGNVHANHLAREGEVSGVIQVEAVTLAALWHGIGAPDGFSLVCDIEGGEVAMVMAEANVLQRAATVIMELHPAFYPEGQETERQVIEALNQAGLVLQRRLADVGLWVRG